MAVEQAPIRATTRGDGRFQLVRVLGSGGMGEVWEAFDLDASETVALKTLPQVDSRALWHFKREFRLLRDLRHPGLVTVHELVRDAHGWFLTMELVHGAPFVEHVVAGTVAAPASTRADSELVSMPQGERGATPIAAPVAPRSPLDLERARAALGRIAVALAHLHDAGIVHCDLKSSNVLVEPDGRVVILDFGLALEATQAGRGGTPAFMAPEQHRKERVTGAADVYALGVMLHEILTARPPFPGLRGAALVDAKLAAELPLLAAVPVELASLAALCRELLAPDPASRPSAHALVTRLAGSDAPAAMPILVGRGAELATLRAAFTDVAERGLVVVAVVGESGIGKTMLAERFVAEAAAEGALVLTAHCSDREHVPFRAVDGVVDDLGQFLAAQPPALRARYTTAEIGLLAQAFPTLRAVAPEDAPAIAEPRERRERMAAAFRALASSVAAEHSMVIWLDDAQWADEDSIALLGALLGAMPRVLLIASARTVPAWLPATTRVVAVGPLASADAALLAQSLVPAARGSAVRAARLAAASGGHPLYLAELVAAAEEIADDAGTAPPQDLPTLVRHQISRVESSTRLLLERVAVAGGPVGREVLAALSDAPIGPAITALRRRRLIASAPLEGAVAFDTFHAAMRSAIVAGLSPAEHRAHHAALARAISAVHPGDDDALATHWGGAGRLDEAFHHGVRAAATAAHALAFERAAGWYRRALELVAQLGRDAATVAPLEAQLGETLAAVGRLPEAAAALRRAAAHEADDDRAAALRRRAAQLLLQCGHLEEGLALLRAELRAVGMREPASGRRALPGLLWGRLAARRLDLAVAPAEPRALSPVVRRQIDTSWSLAHGLSLVDTFAGAVAQTRHVVDAVRSGDPFLAARALALEASYLAALRGSERREATTMDAARRYAHASTHPHAHGLVGVAETVGAYYRGRYAETLRCADRAEEHLVSHCTHVAWELGVVRHHRLFALVYMGEMAACAGRAATLLADVRERGDRHGEVYLRTGVLPFCDLVRDDPAACIEGALGAVDAWAQPRWLVQHYAVFMATTQAELYRGDGEAAAREVAARWPALVSSFLLEISMVRVEAWRLRMRTALVLAQATSGFRRRLHLRTAKRTLRVIEREPGAPGQPFATLARAAIARLQRDDARVDELLALSHEAFLGADMRLMAACVRRSRGLLLGGTAGGALVAEADTWMRAQGIIAPARMAHCLAPGLGHEAS